MYNVYKNYLTSPCTCRLIMIYNDSLFYKYNFVFKLCKIIIVYIRINISLPINENNYDFKHIIMWCQDCQQSV